LDPKIGWSTAFTVEPPQQSVSQQAASCPAFTDRAASA
jgi:hypothetical protein